MKLLLVLFAFTLPLFAKTKKEVKAIAGGKHDRANLIEELSIFGNAREYEAKIVITNAQGEMKPDPFIVKEKTVAGKYIVSEFKTANVEVNIIVTYDKKMKLYRKWVIASANDDVLEFVGNRQDKAMTWTRVDEKMPKDQVELHIEVHHKDRVEWSEFYYNKKEFMYSVKGVATKVK